MTKPDTLTIPAKEPQTAEPLPHPTRVLFVCTGNTCRSPMAAAVANALARQPFESLPESLRESLTPAIVASSAGIFANDGEPIAQNAVAALERAGIKAVPDADYHTHAAHTLTADEAGRYDLLVGLGGGHVMELLLRFPECSGKITGMPEPIPDPYGGDLATYEAALAKITDGVKKLLFPGKEDR